MTESNDLLSQLAAKTAECERMREAMNKIYDQLTFQHDGECDNCGFNNSVTFRSGEIAHQALFSPTSSGLGEQMLSIVKAAIKWYQNGKYAGICDEDCELEAAVKALPQAEIDLLIKD